MICLAWMQMLGTSGWGKAISCFLTWEALYNMFYAWFRVFSCLFYFTMKNIFKNKNSPPTALVLPPPSLSLSSPFYGLHSSMEESLLLTLQPSSFASPDPSVSCFSSFPPWGLSASFPNVPTPSTLVFPAFLPRGLIHIGGPFLCERPPDGWCPIVGSRCVYA